MDQELKELKTKKLIGNCEFGCHCHQRGTTSRKITRQRGRKIFDQKALDNLLEDLACGLVSLPEGRTEVKDDGVHMFVDDMQHNKVDEEPKWQKIEAVMDSGAADSVAPASLAPWVPVAESPGSRRGQHYLSASGDRLPNQGQKKLQVLTEDGTPTTTTYQIADVTRPLCAVSRMCDQDNVVVFTKEGGFVQSPTGQRTNFRRERNVYLLDTWIQEPMRGFTRQ